MKKEDLLNSDFLNQFKTGKEISGFLKEIRKRGIEKILEAELDDHLDDDCHQKRGNSNARNGTTTKKVRTAFGEAEILVPRDRDAASFNPMIVPKRGSLQQQHL